MNSPAELSQVRQPTPFDGVLEQARDMMCTRLDQAVGGMLDQADESLSALSAESQNREERELYQQARDVAASQRQGIAKKFQSHYLGEFRVRSNRAKKIGPSTDADFSLGSLALVSDEDLEETLKFNEMAAKLRRYCDEELLALDQRVGVLLGDAGLQAEDNPFSPQVICDAYKQACRQVDASVGVRRVLLKLFDDYVLDDVRSVYKSVNALLVQNSILPKIRYAVPRKEGRKSAGAPGTESGAEPSAADAGAAGDLFSMLQSLVARNAPAGSGAALGPGAAGAAPLQGAELIGSLTRIQAGDLSGVAGAKLLTGGADSGNVLHELKGTSVGAGMGQMDLMTLDIVAMLFDQLFDDPQVPNGVKGLIGRLQIPILKVAIADKAFFSTKAHPARALLDTLGEIAMRLPADFGTSNPLFPRLEGTLQELLEGFQEHMGIFTAVRERLQALVVEEDQRVEQEHREAARRVEEMENLAHAKSVAEGEVKARVQEQDLPGPVLEFLVQQWLKVLLLIHAREGGEGASWKEALECMDLLVWTVQPKTTLEERRRLASVVPGLLRKLAAGLQSAGIEDGVRADFFGALIKYHTQALSAPAKKPHHGGRRHAAKDGRPAKSVDLSAPVTVKNPFGGGEVSVESLDFTADPANAGLPSDLAIGRWVEFRQKDDPRSRRPVKFIYVSPRKTRYFFAADRAAKDIIQCTRAELERRFRIREAVLIEAPPEDSLFDRVMSGVLGKLGAAGAH